MKKDLYIWSVIYADGSIMCEYDREEGRAFSEVLGKPVKALDIEPLAQNIPAHRVLIPQGATPVFFRRRQIALDADGNEQGRTTTHCIGWKQGEQAVYLFVFSDGTIMLSNDLQAVLLLATTIYLICRLLAILLTTANDISVAAGGTAVGKDTPIGTLTGYGELVPNGPLGTWPALGSESAVPFSSKGNINPVSQVNQAILSGSWTPTLRCNVVG